MYYALDVKCRPYSPECVEGMFCELSLDGVLRSSHLGPEHHAKQSECTAQAHNDSNHEPHQKGDYRATVLIQYLSPGRLDPLCTRVCGR